MTSLLPSPATVAARGITSKASSALKEPLLGKQRDAPTQITVKTGETDDESIIKEEKMSVGNVLMTSVVCVMAAGGFAASAAAMVSIQSIAVIIAGGICCLNAPTVVARQYKLSSTPDLRDSIGLLRDQVNVLTESVDFLQQTVEKLEDEVDDLAILENELTNIVATQGSNAMEFAELVRENEEILDAMKLNLREQFVSELARIILRSDRHGDMKIHKREWPTLALRLKIQLEPHGIDLDTDMFNQMLAEDNDIGSILKFCAEVLYPEVLMEEAPSVANDSFGDLSDDSDDFMEEDERPSLAAFCRSLSMLSEEELKQEVKMTTLDKMEMFTVQDKYSKGSVEVSRGARMSVFPGAQVRKTKYSRLTKIAGEAENRSSKARQTVMKMEKKRASLVGEKKMKKQGKVRFVEI